MSVATGANLSSWIEACSAWSQVMKPALTMRRKTSFWRDLASSGWAPKGE